ncbi:hypothetical protein C1Y08_26200 [Pseudomonas sp. FW306-02-F02-AA]|uniref:Uncharacterized protein n=1 Tax=Pseudomonas fluorescens TaxID=294 RepID=A0A0N7GZK4_PSEFL|nr:MULTISPECIES: hypothetical protein [Pseudomonas]ALI00588.1 hypothetical protein AO353_05800 [Pseudomonas fluorescens]PMZ02006.1 hypothetical protein C1Y07_22385 [Pseudomonas sp. FW306-02-F02-AB]PMZ07982.1 hypothetical protein C1Y06_21550 [Pseudomonas sp. FW306-02-H06C]PMZ12988.1 hypothetical protein C1Y08_26200 [Pseudomonas sp. FW306-02-F02-AA]PMZ19751.1 hypothetical protein C1Y09_22220 [Pseudomonas sp. FW306-02-F08-AA]
MKNDDQLSFPFEARDEQPSGASDLKSAIHLAAASEPNLSVASGKILAFPQSVGMQQNKRATSDQALIARILNRARFFS